MVLIMCGHGLKHCIYIYMERQEERRREEEKLREWRRERGGEKQRGRTTHRERTGTGPFFHVAEDSMPTRQAGP